MKQHPSYVVILAGGKGERLWPLSRQKKPKQLLPFLDERSLLEHTIDNVGSLVSTDRLWMVVNDQHVHDVSHLASASVGRILTESNSRNTAPAVLYACLEIIKKDKHAVVLFVPADHFIVQKILFRHALQNALSFCSATDAICLVGVRPRLPSTQYGYIEIETPAQTSADRPRKVVRFHEKPSLEQATVYCDSKNMLWNIGILCSKVTVLIEAYKKLVPQMVEAVEQFCTKQGDYAACQNISVDYAVLEKSNELYVVPGDFAWSDVGNLDTFVSLHEKYANTCNMTSGGNTVAVNAKNNLVTVPKKLVALIDVDDLCVVETEDVLLIAKRGKTDKVKEIVRTLHENNNQSYL